MTRPGRALTRGTDASITPTSQMGKLSPASLVPLLSPVLESILLAICDCPTALPCGVAGGRADAVQGQ